MNNYTEIFETAVSAAVEAGGLILSGSPLQIKTKSLSDYVTEVDLKCQDKIKEIISSTFPEHSFLAEEDGRTFESVNNLWIIDPLDGTTNFIHGLKHSAVSIAYYTESEVKVGIVYNPYTREMFHAVKGEGAFLNGERVSVSSTAQMKTSLIATGMPFRKPEKAAKYFSCLSEVLRNCSGIRRMGSAALDIVYTACGRFEAFFEGWLSPWDIAAGILIAEEAGAKVTDFKGEYDYFENGCIIVSTEYLYSDVFEIVNKHLKDEQ